MNNYKKLTETSCKMGINICVLLTFSRISTRLQFKGLHGGFERTLDVLRYCGLDGEPGWEQRYDFFLSFWENTIFLEFLTFSQVLWCWNVRPLREKKTILVYWLNEYLIVVGGGDWVSWVSNPINFDGRTEVDEILTARRLISEKNKVSSTAEYDSIFGQNCVSQETDILWKVWLVLCKHSCQVIFANFAKIWLIWFDFDYWVTLLKIFQKFRSQEKSVSMCSFWQLCFCCNFFAV